MKLSICCITYNHALFIKDALEGFLAQHFDADWEIVVSDDGSVDETRAILQSYNDLYPGQFRLIVNERNLGMMPNFLQALQACQGEYIALCEGDDYWIDPEKLKRQVSFLDAHPEYVLSYHRVLEKASNHQLSAETLNTELATKDVDLLYLARQGNCIHTPSVVFRNVLPDFPAFMQVSPAGDYPLYLLLMRHGKAHYFPETMAVYRKHGASAWSASMKVLYSRWLEVLVLLIREFEKEPAVHEALLLQLQDTYSKFFERAVEEGDGKLVLDRTAFLFEALPDFARCWLQNLYPAQLEKIMQFPAGVKKAGRHFLREIGGKLKQQ